ncbi:MAG: MBL fold metallo-hydrolase [Pseudomonadota bacterium]
MPTAILLEIGDENIVVDCGLGVTRGICDQGLSLTQIDRILITHLHSDHYLEFGPFLHTAWVAGLKRVLPVHGPDGLATYWEHFLSAMEFDVSLRIEDEGRVPLTTIPEIRTLQPGVIVETENLKITAMRNNHPPIVESFALRIESEDRTAVLSGDTAYMGKMAEFAEGADVLVHEAMLIEGVDALVAKTPNGDERLRQHILRSHTSAEDVGRIARDAGVKHLVLNHFVPDGILGFGDDEWMEAARTHWEGPLNLARDGQMFEF